MKALFLAVSAAALTATLPASAAIIVTVGSSAARSCYLAALGQNSGTDMVFECDRALADQSLKVQDRLATHVNRGILRMLRGDDLGAEFDFNEAMALDAAEAEAWLNMGVLRYRQGNSEAAVKMFDRALALQTKKPAVAHFGRALAHEDRGNLKAAYADLLRARALNPQWSEPATELRRYKVLR